MSLHEIEKLAANMRHAGSFLNCSAFIKPIKTCEGVSLQYAFIVGQVLLRMFAFSVRRVCKPYRRRGLIACRTVIANVGPESTYLGPAGTWRENRQWSIVAV